ncbi:MULTISPECIES: hypothetical protein [Streptomyces]|uniref:hypothetical protein n=1 Tax=Streptomyces TaxID=1883 RepID=UPI00069ABF0C|nr:MULTISPECIES: hypothetical protein [Streptomyces]MDX2928640.1 hypothetical protein [Streptomyces sp. NRRL_B-16638]MDX3350525.1 hypothetical protein [Streptomyces sp. ME02-6979A]MDX3370844.1 hypothetical protein [Streptomyces sp. ME02-6987-2C]MDX3398492.1 hypothetical protein [Streptomyces sp. ME01-18h]MDX3404651.1 hypothetical protein [Streptomyces sp. ME02-6977A]
MRSDARETIDSLAVFIERMSIVVLQTELPRGSPVFEAGHGIALLAPVQVDEQGGEKDGEHGVVVSSGTPTLFGCR